MDLAGAEYPTEHDGRAILPMEGRSLLPAFQGAAIEREALYWEHEGNRAVRVGDWKLVAKENRPWELYDLAADRTEGTNLAGSMPEKAQELETLWNTWAERANVLPLGTWRAEANRP